MQFQSDGAELFVTEQGGGAPLVLLHPSPVDHRFWLPIAGMLAVRYRVILPDLRGHGRSQAGEGAITVQKLGADIERMLDELGVQRALFAGCSIGGYTLYELWRRCPDRVQALAVCCSRAQADTEQTRATRRQHIENLRERGSGEFIETMLKTLIGPTARTRWPQKLAEAREMMQATPAASIMAVQQGLAERPDSIATAKTIKAPVCVVGAAEDGGSTPADMRLLAETIRGGGGKAEYHELPDGGHFLPWEQPETVGRILRKFFDQVRSGT